MTAAVGPPLGSFLGPWGGALHDLHGWASSPHCSCGLLLQLQLQKSQYLQLGPSRGQYYGGSLPNVNQIGSGTVDLPFQVSPHAPTQPPTWYVSHLGPTLVTEQESMCVGRSG